VVLSVSAAAEAAIVKRRLRMKIVNNIQEAIPLMINAIVSSDLVLMNALLDKFPKLIAMRNKSGHNLLMMAAYYSQPNIVNYLISFYVIANPMIDPEEKDNDELTAYDWAVLAGNEFARSLLSKVMDNGDDI
jgi:ankyrin repeat protein